MSADEFDNMPDDFADISGVDWARILAGPSDTANPASVEDQSQNSDLPGTGGDLPVPSISALPSTSSSSSTYNFEDEYEDFDPSLLAELDRIEEEIAGGKAIALTKFVNSLLNFSLFAAAVAPKPPSDSNLDLHPSHYFSCLFSSFLWSFWWFLML